MRQNEHLSYNEKYIIICIHYLVLEYSTRNKQRKNREINPMQRDSERKPTTISRKMGFNAGK